MKHAATTHLASHVPLSGAPRPIAGHIGGAMIILACDIVSAGERVGRSLACEACRMNAFSVFFRVAHVHPAFLAISPKPVHAPARPRRSHLPGTHWFPEDQRASRDWQPVYQPAHHGGNGPTDRGGQRRRAEARLQRAVGPVAAVVRARDRSHAVELANRSRFGLGASLHTRDTASAEQLAGELEAGMVFVNGIVKSDPRLPFGGVKDSGYGRELAEVGLREFVNTKTVWIG